MLSSIRFSSARLTRGAGQLSRKFSAERDVAPLVIRNGTVVNHDGMFKADVLTTGGKITKVGVISEDEAAGARSIDATGRYVMPGGIDTHTHLEMPFMGTTTIDDYHYGTQAAVAGGTTTLMDFVIPGRGQSMLEAHDQWVAKAKPKINCDVAFHMAVTWFSDQVLEEMDELTNKRGINSYKFFLAYNNVLRMYDNKLLLLFVATNFPAHALWRCLLPSPGTTTSFSKSLRAARNSARSHRYMPRTATWSTPGSRR